MWIKQHFTLFLFLTLLTGQLLGQSSASKYSNAFLGIGVDARAMAMGNSVVAHISDAPAGYWNPAGLASLDQYSFAAMHAEYFSGIAQYDYLAGALPVSKGVMGLSFIRFGVDNILNTTQLIDENGNVDYDRITTFSAADYAFIVSYATPIEKIEGLSLGGNLKVVYRGIGDFANALGFGIDAGVQYKRNGWNFGANVFDITTTVNSWTFKTDDFEEVFQRTGNELPEDGLEITLPRVQMGGGYQFKLSEDINLLTEINANLTFDGQRNAIASNETMSLYPMAGFELGWRDMIFLRGGANGFQYVQSFSGEESLAFKPNIGVGFKYAGIALDYALTDIAGNSGGFYSNVFSLRLNLDKK